MRLIDADKFEVISWRAQGGREYANGFDDGVDYVARKIDKAETVKAIPIEWLQRRRDIYLKAYHAGHESEIRTAAILNDTLMAWQKEQGEKENEENTDN